MNEHVKYGLDLYVEDTDPQCAIMIKGDWDVEKHTLSKNGSRSRKKIKTVSVKWCIYLCSASVQYKDY